jgi:NAD(P)H-dependent FMN reductase
LKHHIDGVRHEWHAKPVALVSYGGISGGLRASEALRPVFAEVHAMTIRHTLSFAFPWTQFDAGGSLPEAAEAEAATTLLLDQLAWWAHALRDARAARPYVA